LRSGNVSALGTLVTAAYRHDDGAIALNEIHASARTEKLAHFKHAIADGFDITQVAALRLLQTARQPDARCPIT
jgi:hypothetical protein